MARPRLRTPDQPAWLRLLLGTFEFLASLKLAVVLLASAALVLGWATFVESKYGLRAVHFGIYGAWWFTALNLLLAVNIFCAAAIRYPWKRHQTGFVITHIGLLTLMFGTLLSRRGGIDAQMPIWEGQSAYKAYEDSEHFELEIEATDKHATSPVAATPAPAAHDTQVLVRTIPFRGGPFNWQTLAEMGQLPGRPESTGQGIGRWLVELASLPNRLAWRLAPRDAGLLYDHDGIRLEVLDYYSNSQEVEVPKLSLKMSTPRMPKQGAEGREELSPERWVPVELSVRSLRSELFSRRPQGIGSRQQLGGGSVVYWLAGSEAEVQSFLDSRPTAPLGQRGQVILHAAGQRVVWSVDERVGQGRVPLGTTGLDAELSQVFRSARLQDGNGPDGLELAEGAEPDAPAEQPAVEILVFRGESRQGRLVLFADLPEFNQQAGDVGVVGHYWFDHGEKDAAQLLQGEGGSRIDILETPDGSLRYRYWNRHDVAHAGTLPADGTRVPAFKMPVAQLEMYVDEHLPSPTPTVAVRPVAFAPSTTAPDARRAARIRATVDGQREEFWLVGAPVFDALIGQTPSPRKQHTVEGRGRRVTFRLPLDEIDLGFQVRLEKFERKLDPGTSQAAHYSSTVDLLARDKPEQVLRDKVFITMNAPIDFSSPVTGRSYRLFQESFQGPFLPGDPLYERFAPAGAARPSVAISVLTVNHDPGRGVKYVGCLLVVAGIATMFYMRAYFFKPAARATPPTTTTRGAGRPAEPSSPERTAPEFTTPEVTTPR